MINRYESEVISMSNEMWEELDYIFYKNKKLAEEHEDLAEAIKIINDLQKLQAKFQKENEKLQMKLQSIMNNEK